MERRGRTQSRKQLLEKAWDVESGVSDRIQTRTVDMHVRRLRSKLGDVGGWIETVRGFGYRLKVPSGVD
jgi:two-component system phosphate regulon response regulator PhoB